MKLCKCYIYDGKTVFKTVTAAHYGDAEIALIVALVEQHGNVIEA